MERKYDRIDERQSLAWKYTIWLFVILVDNRKYFTDFSAFPTAVLL